jgi:hypothetical protein
LLTFDVDARVLGRVRFCVSPLWTVARILSRARQNDAPVWRARCREAMRSRRLPLLAALYRPSVSYVPDFLAPLPDAFATTIDDELHRVASTDVTRVRAEMTVSAHGLQHARISGAALAPPLLATLDKGEDALAQQLADELERFWRHAVRPRWPELRARMEADVTRRTRQIARHGMTAMLSGLHPAVSWLEDGRLTVATRFHARIGCAEELLLVPAVVGGGLDVSLDPTPLPGRCRPVVLYPAPPGAGTASGSRPPLAELLGATRALLRADVACPRTTSDLAGRHRLAPSSVSHHLGVLHRSGLVSRFRQGKRVFYVATGRAGEFVAGA